MRPAQSLSDLMLDVKGGSSKRINEKNLSRQGLTGRKDFGAFSYIKSRASGAIAYKQNQEAHYRKITFLNEYKKFLEKFEVDFDERYIFNEAE